jgi:hypothetical protein
MELSHEQLSEICRKCGITSLYCEQGYEDTLQDVLDDNPEYSRESRDAKIDTIDRMLMDSLDFGPASDVYDLDEGETISRMELRDSVLEEVVPKFVDGEYSGGGKTELELAQEECNRILGVD